ncbi:MAG: Asp23/Gls24 family envelope stress response protein [Lachnospiraceae bacterium]|nr:Asp23/Gls24 family envelope stress response protein [Lachnospiraceae bacterium]
MQGQGKIHTKLGMISVDKEVIATYAGSVAVECFGIVGMAAVNVKDGLVKLLKKDYLSHGIDVRIGEDNEISLAFHVIISYGVSVATVAENLMSTVKYKLEAFTGMPVKRIRISVEGIRVID